MIPRPRAEPSPQSLPNRCRKRQYGTRTRALAPTVTLQKRSWREDDWLVSKGTAVACIDIDEQRAEHIAGEIVGRGGIAIPIVADMSDPLRNRLRR